MRNLVLALGMNFFIGCANESYILYEAADGSPRQWLGREFGQEPFVNSINFYIENNPWSRDFQRAISLTEDSAYLVIIEKKDVYKFNYYNINYLECKGLRKSMTQLSEQLTRYKENPQLAEDEAIVWLDGPTYTLESFGSLPYEAGPYLTPKIWGYGNIIELVSASLEIAEQCSAQLRS